MDKIPEGGFGSVRVLIADDSAEIRKALSSLIARIPGVELVGAAKTGAEALELVRSLRPEVLTLDIRMPKMSGISVLQAIRDEGLCPMVIVLSGVSELEYERKCLELGAAHFFNKTTEFEKAIALLTQRARELARPAAKNPPLDEPTTAPVTVSCGASV